MNKGIYFATFTALLWGFLAIAIKVALDVLPPVTVSWLRFSIAFAFLSGFYLFRKPSRLKILAKPPKYAVFAGIALGLNYLGFIWGIDYTSPSIGQIFIQIGPVLLAVSGFIVFREKVSVRQAIGLTLVVIGMLLYYQEQIIHIAGGLRNYKLGVLLIIFGGIMWAVYAVFQKLAVREYNPMQLNLILFGIPMLYFLPLLDFSPITQLSMNGWLLIIFLGLNTLGAYGSLAYALKYLEANKISVIITLNPLITFGVMALLGNIGVSWIEAETFSFLTILGALIVISGVVLTVMRK